MIELKQIKSLNQIKLKEKFWGIVDLYTYLRRNPDKVEDLIGIKLQEPLKEKGFSLTGKEAVTEKNILFFASNREFIRSLGQMIIFAGALDADIVVLFLTQGTIKEYFDCLGWLKKICNDDTEFILVQADY